MLSFSATEALAGMDALGASISAFLEVDGEGCMSMVGD